MDSSSAGRLAGLFPGPQTATGRLLRLSRPRFWLYLAGPALVGVTYAAETAAGLVDPLLFGLIGYFLLPANVFLYGVNDVFDAEIDRANPKKGPEGPEQRFTGDRLVRWSVVVTGLLGLPLLFLLPLAATLPFVAFHLLSVGYSAPPLRFKTTPLVDSLSNGLYVLPGVVTYATVAGRWPPLLAVLGGWLWTMAMHTFSAIPDIDPDTVAGIRTTATWLGATGSLAYCGVCWLAAAAAMALVHPLLLAPFGLYPLLIVMIQGAGVPVERAYWWFPWINGLLGMVLTLGGLRVIVGG